MKIERSLSKSLSGKEKSESDNEQSSDNFQKSASRRRDIVNKRRLARGDLPKNDEENIQELDQQENANLLKEHKQDEEDDRPIPLYIMQPKHIMPIQINFMNQVDANTQNPLLYIPSFHPSIKLFNTTYAESLWTDESVANNDIINSNKPNNTNNISDFKSNDRKKDNYVKLKRDEEETHAVQSLLDRDAFFALPRNDDNNSKANMKDREEEEEDRQPDEEAILIEVRNPSRSNEGLHRRECATRTPLFFVYTEKLPDALTKMVPNKVSSDMEYSRITQRLLRDIFEDHKKDAVREMWMKLTSKQPSVRVPLIAEDKNKSDISGWKDQPTTLRGDNKVSGSVELVNRRDTVIKLDAIEASLVVFEDVLTDTLVQPMKHQVYLEDDDLEDSFVDENNPGIGNSNFIRLKSARSSMKMLAGNANTYLNKNRGATLKIIAQELCLSNHPYMCEEESSFFSLKLLYANYCGLLQKSSMDYLTYRLIGMLTDIQATAEKCLLGKSTPVENSELHIQYLDILETLQSLTTLKESIDNISHNLYEKWKEISLLRKKQGFTSTRAKLIARKLEVDLPSSKKEERIAKNQEESLNTPFVGAIQRWSQLQQQLTKLPKLIASIHSVFQRWEEMKTDDAASDNDEVQSQSSQRDDRIKSKASADNNKQISFTVSEGQREKLKEMKNLQNNRVKELVKSSVEYLLESESLLPGILYRLTATGNVTPDNQVPLEELERREKLRRILIRVELSVNGHIVSSTEQLPLEWPSLKVDIRMLYELRILVEPSDVSLLVYAAYSQTHLLAGCCSLAKESLLAKVGVGLPHNTTEMHQTNGVTAFCFTSVVDWYSFSSTNRIVASQGRGLPDVASHPYANPHESSIRFEGAVLCGSQYDVGFDAPTNSIMKKESVDGVMLHDVAWIGESANGLPVGLNETGTSNSRSKNVGKMVLDRLEFTREKDFFDLLPSVNDIDINDPRNDNMVQKIFASYLNGKNKKGDIFQLTGHIVTSVFGEEGSDYLNFLKFQPSDRLKLLQLRSQRPYLFNDPIPLSIQEIRRNEVFKNILNRANGNTGSSALVEDDPALRAIAEEGEELGELNDEMANDMSKKAISFLQKVRESNTATSRGTRKKQIVTSAVVHENPSKWENYSLMDFFDVNITLIPPPKRSLKPRPIERLPEAIPSKQVNLLVQVVGARNIPTRKFSSSDGPAIVTATKSKKMKKKKTRRNRDDDDEDEDADDSEEDEGGFHNSDDENMSQSTRLLRNKKQGSSFMVRSFVEVSFQSHTERTTVVEGVNPNWKQSLSLPFFPPQGDYSHGNLSKIDDIVCFSLFDEIIQDDAPKGGFLHGENTERVERFYLGSFSLPFSIIHSEKRIEGTFRLNIPPFNMGYDQMPSAVHRPKPRLGQEEHWLFQCLQAVFASAPPDPDAFANALGSYIDNEILEEFDIFCCGLMSTPYISIMATMDPLLSQSPHVDQEISALIMYPPDRPLSAYAMRWLRQLRDSGPHLRDRSFPLFGSNSDGYSVLICRYLSPQPPPMPNATRRSCVNIVSLIPFLKDSNAFIGETDLWCTNSQLWEILAGDEEEHAVALYNYLYYLSLVSHSSVSTANESKRNSSDNNAGPVPGYPDADFVAGEELFLVLGCAVPEGSTTYILIRKAGRLNANDSKKNAIDNSAKAFLLINPCTGYVYSADDPNCPLREINCLATPYNLWANVQVKSDPKSMNYDLFNMKNWRPFFGPFKAPIANLSSIQEPVIYTPTSTVNCLEIEKILKTSIKSSLRKWRAHRPKAITSFHADASAIITDLLSDLEEWKMYGRVSSFGGEGGERGEGGGSVAQKPRTGSSRITSDSVPFSVLREIEHHVNFKLKSILTTRTLYGCPLNIPYTDTNSILATIQALCIHESKHPDAQFVLGVRVFPLYNNLVSLWIFVGILEKNA